MHTQEVTHSLSEANRRKSMLRQRGYVVEMWVNHNRMTGERRYVLEIDEPTK